MTMIVTLFPTNHVFSEVYVAIHKTVIIIIIIIRTLYTLRITISSEFLTDSEIPFSAFRLSLHISDVTPVALDVVTLFVATQMEKLHLPSLSSALAVTWLMSGVIQVARVCYIVIRVDMFYTYVRFYGYIITLILYVGLFVNDVRIYFLKVSLPSFTSLLYKNH